VTYSAEDLESCVEKKNDSAAGWRKRESGERPPFLVGEGGELAPKSTRDRFFCWHEWETMPQLHDSGTRTLPQV